MASSLTYYTELQTPTVNGDVDLWGNILNATTDAWDRALAGEATASLAAGDWTPSTTEGECLVLTATGILGTARQIIVPAKHRRYIVKNDTTGAFSVTIKTSGGAGIVCSQGLLTYVYCNGTDCFLLGATGAYYPIGTSGATVPLNNGNNTSSGNVTYSGTSAFTGAVTMSGGSGSPLTVQWSDDGAGAGPAVNATRVSASPAANDLIGLWNFRGRDSGGNDTIYGRIQSQIIDPTDTSEDGGLAFYTMQAGTLTIGMSQRLGLFMAGTTDQGVGTINATGLYQGGVALGTAAFVNTGTSGATVPLLNAPSTFSGGAWTIDGSTTTLTPFVVQYSDDGAGVGPQVDLRRVSASPAASDRLAALRFVGRDSAAATTAYSQIEGRIVDPTDGSEDGGLVFRNLVAGASTIVGYFEQGLVVGTPAGLDKGAGTINATTIYQNNVALGTAAFVATGTSGATIPLLNGNNTYSGSATFTAAVTMSGNAGAPLQLTYADDGASFGPTLVSFRDSASPAASDQIGAIRFDGRDSAANQQEYSRIYTVITDPTSGSEDGVLVSRTIVAGTLAARWNVGAGVWTETATGGDQGAGTVNATGYYKNGNLLKVTTQVITASGTYTPTTGAVYAIVELVGGGGGGGGADVSTSSDWTGSGGGGGGGYSRKLITLSGTYSVTIGAAGTVGNNTGGNGGTGGTTTFGTGPLLQATGGSGGTGSAAGGDPGGGGGAGGVGSSGDFNAEGQGGGPGISAATPGAISGAGGASMLGGGGRGQYRNSSSSGVLAGATGGNYGGGGGGAVNIKTTAGTTGGLGAAGVVIVTEFTL